MSKVVDNFNHAIVYNVYKLTHIMITNITSITTSLFIHYPLELPQAFTCTVTSVTIVKRVLVSTHTVDHAVAAVVLVYTTVSIQRQV